MFSPSFLTLHRGVSQPSGGQEEETEVLRVGTLNGAAVVENA